MPIVTNTEYKIRAKKRQRGNVPHKPVGPETKIFYPLNSANNPASDTTFITFYTHPGYYADQQTSTKEWNMYPYETRRLNWPTTGTGSNNRIGNKITAKLMRFKGMFRVYYNLSRPVRMRLYYFYYKAHGFSDYSASHIKDYVSPVTYTTSAADSYIIYLNNYYNSQWKDKYINNENFFKTKIAEWYIKPYPPILAPGQLISGRQHEVGQSGNVVEGVSWTQANAFNTCAYVIPFDKTVYLNQEVICDQDNHYLYWEVDGGFGIANQDATFFGSSLAPNAPTPYEIVTKSEPPIAAQFKLIYYFQDD